MGCFVRCEELARSARTITTDSFVPGKMAYNQAEARRREPTTEILNSEDGHNDSDRYLPRDSGIEGPRLTIRPARDGPKYSRRIRMLLPSWPSLKNQAWITPIRFGCNPLLHNLANPRQPRRLPAATPRANAGHADERVQAGTTSAVARSSHRRSRVTRRHLRWRYLQAQPTDTRYTRIRHRTATKSASSRQADPRNVRSAREGKQKSALCRAAARSSLARMISSATARMCMGGVTGSTSAMSRAAAASALARTRFGSTAGRRSTAVSRTSSLARDRMSVNERRWRSSGAGRVGI